MRDVNLNGLDRFKQAEYVLLERFIANEGTTNMRGVVRYFFRRNMNDILLVFVQIENSAKIPIGKNWNEFTL